MTALLKLLALILGIDLSHWSGVVDWLKVRTNNIVQFVFIKCTEALDFFDDQYTNNYNGCIAQKFPFGPYHFYRHNGKPVQQAEWFHAHIGAGVKVAVCDAETTVLEVINDVLAAVGKKPLLRGASYAKWQSAIKTVRTVAGNSNINSTSLTALVTKAVAMIDSLIASLAGDVYTFCQWLEDEGYKAVIYSSPGFIQSFLQDERLAKFFLWIAHIGVTEPTIPPPWAQFGKWLVNKMVCAWQNLWDLVVDGVPEAAVDGNLWNPAAGDMYTWFGNGEPYNPSDPKLPNYVYSLSTTLRIRSSVWGTVVGYITDKSIAYKVLESQTDSNGDKWYRIGKARWVAGWLCEVIE